MSRAVGISVAFVSISQSRCLSFQGVWDSALVLSILGFNLAIEMLIISGCRGDTDIAGYPHVSISQSRCLSFQVGQMTKENWSL